MIFFKIQLFIKKIGKNCVNMCFSYNSFDTNISISLQIQFLISIKLFIKSKIFRVKLCLWLSHKSLKMHFSYISSNHKYQYFHKKLFFEIQFFIKKYIQGKIVFMAPTKPLVAQQIEACFNVMGIPQVNKQARNPGTSFKLLVVFFT